MTTQNPLQSCSMPTFTQTTVQTTSLVLAQLPVSKMWHGMVKGPFPSHRPALGTRVLTGLSLCSGSEKASQSSLQLKMQVPKRSEDRVVITCIPIHEACGFNKPRCAHDIVVNTLLSTFQQNPSSRVLAKHTKPHKYNCILNYYSLAFLFFIFLVWRRERGGRTFYVFYLFK